MADERKFRFVSPGVFITEIDRSQIPALPDLVGPVIIGRSRRGPAFTPTRVSSLTEFVNTFGDTVPGTTVGNDTWRTPGQSAALYGPYAAQAHLSVGSTPLTYMRLLGVENAQAAGDDFGEAGFQVPTNPTNDTANETAGAFGLFLFQSGTSPTGTLAAVFYASGAAVYPTGTLYGEGTAGAGMNKLFDLGSTPEITIEISSSSTVEDKKTVSLDDTAANYIRKALNTNPQAITYRRAGTSVEPNIGSVQQRYWLGETFERTIKEDVIDGFSGNYLAAIVPLNKQDTAGLADRRDGYREAQTPWFISQDLSSETGSFNPADRQRAKPLFKFVSLNGQGEDANERIKVSISRIRYSPNTNVAFGTFDVLIRDASDADTSPEVLERFSSVNLDPNSADYILTRIGDRYLEYDQSGSVLRAYGDFTNQSQYVRVVVSNEVETGGATELLPFGYYGIPKFADSSISSSATSVTDTFVNKGGYDALNNTGSATVLSSSTSLTSLVQFPSIPTRVSASDLSNNRTSYFGVSTANESGSTAPNRGYVDYTRFLGANVISAASWNDNFGLEAAPAGTQYQDAFTLDDVVLATGSNYSLTASPRDNITAAYHESGSRAGGTSFTARSGEVSYKNILDAGFEKFTAPMFGGFDGLDILEREPLRNKLMDGISPAPTRENNYVLNTYRTAIDILSDAEQFEFNLMSIPGVWYSGVTDRVLEVCEQRGDALGVIDVQGGYIPAHEEYFANRADRKGKVQTVLNEIDTRNLNNSYGATYYPWVVINDTNASVPVRVPPSVPAIGVLANTERVADVWFAPAGFNRGGLTTGQGGVSVLGVDEVLNSTDRDRLYERNINPIARFPAEGIVVFGQKTLQATPSALDRINVRRLLIFLKKGISRIASGTLFEQNVPATWRNFKATADNFLSNVKVRFGLDDFRVVLDETTTTPDLVDRNILYAKVFIKPTRSIEFIALDFVITRSGASFDD